MAHSCLTHRFVGQGARPITELAGNGELGALRFGRLEQSWLGCKSRSREGRNDNVNAGQGFLETVLRLVVDDLQVEPCQSQMAGTST